jgi:histidinol-phosphate aminotransferase
MHPVIARATSTRWVPAERSADFGLDPLDAVTAIEREQPDVVFVTSPNNPTGAALPLPTIEAICAAAPGMVVLDEAYAEFNRDPAATSLTLLADYPRLIVVRTMSKAFALAGARVGYLAADPAVIGALLVVRLPYHLSAVTQAVALAALGHPDELLSTVARIRAERDALVAWLRGIGLTAADSDANFVLFGPFADRHAVWQALLDQGVLIRESGPPPWLRVSIGTADEMLAFRQALTNALADEVRTGTGAAG